MNEQIPWRDVIENKGFCATRIMHRYLNRISGRLLERIDIHAEVVPFPFVNYLMNEKVKKVNLS